MSGPELFIKKSYRRSLLSCSLLMAGTLSISVPANACGPDFINRLLLNRNDTLLYMPEGNFAFETRGLVDIDKQLPQWNIDRPEPVSDKEFREKLTTRQQQAVDVVDKMRASNNLEQADALSQGLEPEERLYTLGAVAFKLMDPKAADYFTQVLALPESEQQLYGLDAQYSLGRVLMGDYSSENTDGSVWPITNRPDEDQLKLALVAFQNVIDRVKNGEPDVTTLSLSSLGQQARIHLWLGDIVTATRLYAQQAAQGDPSGQVSLRFIANALIDPKNENALEQAIKDPLVR